MSLTTSVANCFCPAVYERNFLNHISPLQQHCAEEIASTIGTTSHSTNILFQTNFQNITKGNIAFFRHIKTLAQYGISEAQKIFHPYFFNITHAAVVLNATKEQLCLAEAVREGAKVTCYSSDDLVQEEICVPQNMDTEAQKIKSSIPKIILDKLKDPLDYNFEGASLQPFTPKKLTLSQKENLIRACIDHQIDGGLIHNKKSYFCSELALEVTQIAYLAHRIPNLQKLVDEQLTGAIHLSSDRAAIIERVLNQIDQKALWNNLDKDPLFQSNPLSTSPADLFSTIAMTSPFICVTPKNLAKTPCDEAASHDCAEYLTTRQLVRYTGGENVALDDPEMQKLILELSKSTSYSKETLSCGIKELQNQSTDILQRLDRCFSDTLSYREQLTIYGVRAALTAALKDIEQKPHLIEKLQLEDEKTLEEALVELFPYSPLKSNYFLINIYILLSLRDKDPAFLAKYLPLAIGYDSSIRKKIQHIGLAKLPPDFGQQSVSSLIQKIAIFSQENIECVTAPDASKLLACLAKFQNTFTKEEKELSLKMLQLLYSLVSKTGNNSASLIPEETRHLINLAQLTVSAPSHDIAPLLKKVILFMQECVTTSSPVDSLTCLAKFQNTFTQEERKTLLTIGKQLSYLVNGKSRTDYIIEPISYMSQINPEKVELAVESYNIFQKIYDHIRNRLGL